MARGLGGRSLGGRDLIGRGIDGSGSRASFGGAKIPAWVAAGALIDEDFVNGLYWPRSVSSEIVDTRASAKYVTNASGVLVPVLANVLPISNTGMLIEAANTNLWLQSQTFSNASWSKDNSSVSSGIAAPDGTSTAFSLIEDNTNNNHALRQSVTVVNATVYEVSVYAVKNSRSRLSFFEGSVTAARATFDINAGTILSTAGGGSPSAAIASVTGGYYRCSMLFTAGSSATVSMNIYMQSDAQTGIGAYLGDGVSNLAPWGAQVTAGASSYIPTTTGTVTRAADSAVIQRTGIGRVVFTFDDNSQQTVSGIDTGAQYTIPTNLNRPLIKRLTGYVS